MEKSMAEVLMDISIDKHYGNKTEIASAVKKRNTIVKELGFDIYLELYLDANIYRATLDRLCSPPLVYHPVKKTDRNIRRSTDKVYEAVCLWCGEPFTSMHHNCKYCGDECRELAKKPANRQERLRRAKDHAWRYWEAPGRIKDVDEKGPEDYEFPDPEATAVMSNLWEGKLNQ